MKRRRTIGIVAVGAAVLVAVALWRMRAAEDTPPLSSTDAGPAATAPSAPAAKTVQAKDVQALEGRWVRTDSPYIIEIGVMRRTGTLQAAYYNPNPINVARAELSESVAGPVVTIELRDVNYPGSTYTLTYDRTRDALIGSYFQAVERQTFEVAFVRAR